ncbi:MAG: nitrilase family protein [Bacteroidales bacterium]|nr:nitrilase family protein [Bacteroidales bacterium]
MKVTLLQMDIAWGDPSANSVTAARLIEANPGSELYVLPEMWSTGFATDPVGIAEEYDPEPVSLVWMKETAGKTGAAVAGSVAVHDTDGSYRNRFYFVKPDGEVTFYDKHHLFTYSGEHHRYKAGESRCVVEWKGVRFILNVCYDLRFPLWVRSREDYVGMLYVASWPPPRVEAWRTLLKARAIENQAFLLGVNRVGNDPSCVYCGGTAFVDPYGVATEAPDNQEYALTAEIDLPALEEFRMKFPVLKDRDF